MTPVRIIYVPLDSQKERLHVRSGRCSQQRGFVHFWVLQSKSQVVCIFLETFKGNPETKNPKTEPRSPSLDDFKHLSGFLAESAQGSLLQRKVYVQPQQLGGSLHRSRLFTITPPLSKNVWLFVSLTFHFQLSRECVCARVSPGPASRHCD